MITSHGYRPIKSTQYPEVCSALCGWQGPEPPLTWSQRDIKNIPKTFKLEITAIFGIFYSILRSSCTTASLSVVRVKISTSPSIKHHLSRTIRIRAFNENTRLQHRGIIGQYPQHPSLSIYMRPLRPRYGSPQPRMIKGLTTWLPSKVSYRHTSRRIMSLMKP